MNNDEAKKAVKEALIYLASRCDGAVKEDGVGFNGRDTTFGRSLARQLSGGSDLSVKQYQTALKMLKTYRTSQLKGVVELPPHNFVFTPGSILQASERCRNTIKVSKDGEKLAIDFDYHPDLVAAAKEIDGSRFDGGTKTWYCPIEQVAQVYEIFEPFEFEFDKKVLNIIETLKEEERLIQEELEERAEWMDDFIATRGWDWTWKPMSHQWDTVDFLAKQENSSFLIADEPGLGKTKSSLMASLCALGYHEYVTGDKAALIVICPATLKQNWIKEASHLDMSLEVYSQDKIPQPFSKPYYVIADECFDYNAMVTTSKGNLSIGYIVDNNLDVDVLSYGSNGLEFKPINRWIKCQRQTRFVKIKHTNGELICTENHKIYIEGVGYVKAIQVQNNQELYCMPERVSGITVKSKDFSLLLENLQRSKSESNEFGTNETKKSNVGFSDTGKSISNFEGNKSQTKISRGEWEGFYKITNSIDTFTEQNFNNSGVYGIHTAYKKSLGYILKYPQTLQNRCGNTPVQISYRNRWEQSHSIKEKSSRHQKNDSVILSRVESVEILESSSYQQYGISDNGDYVYNLEIDDNHNYFAEGVLVSNCHAFQNLKAQRTEKFLKLAKDENCIGVICLTATPMKNGQPKNLYPLLRAIGHKLGSPFKKRYFEQRYCNARATAFCKWDTTGAINLDELNQEISDKVLRRTKADCLDLPPKTIIDIECEYSRELDDLYNHEFSRYKMDYECAVSDDEKSDKGKALVMMGLSRRLSSLYKVNQAIKMAEEILEQGQQVVLFTDFVESAQKIAAHFNVEALTGDTPQKQVVNGVDVFPRQQMVDDFQSGFNRVFVGTIKAGGVGITLTSSSYMIIVDLPWTPGDLEQVTDRVHRIGTKDNVTIYHLYAKDIDYIVAEKIGQKTDNIAKVLKKYKIKPENLSKMSLTELAEKMFKG